eukprot:3571638-Rhodomonas_salina.1
MIGDNVIENAGLKIEDSVGDSVGASGDLVLSDRTWVASRRPEAASEGTCAVYCGVKCTQALLLYNLFVPVMRLRVFDFTMPILVNAEDCQGE